MTTNSSNDTQPKIPTWAIWITAIWVIFAILGLIPFTHYNPNKVSLSDIGGYLSGVFAPIAWFWFYLSYRVQSEELQLQRQELQNSVQAQQGSEIALRQQADTLRVQTETLAEQLRIGKEQWNSYLADKEKSKPVFIVDEYDYRFTIILSSSMNGLLQDERDDLSFDTVKQYIPDKNKRLNAIRAIVLVLDIKNIAADCRIKSVKLQYPNENMIAYDFKISEKNSEMATISLHYRPTQRNRVNVFDYDQSAESNVFNKNIILIDYSYKESSDTDTYRVIYDEQYKSYSIEKVELADC